MYVSVHVVNKGREIERSEKDRQAGRQADRQTGRQTDRKTERKTDRKRKTEIKIKQKERDIRQEKNNKTS